MNAVWTRLHRLVSGVMLVAVASFVLHGAAVAGGHRHGPGSPGCATDAPGHAHGAAMGAAVHDHSGSSHESATHDHGPGAVHSHGVHAHAAQAEAPEGAAEAPCCGAVCTTVLQASGPGAIPTPMTLAATLVPDGQRGAGIDPNGLKRPPRTPCIA